jgi:hypothetical protein
MEKGQNCMRATLISRSNAIAISAAAPQRDRTSRILKAMQVAKDAWTNAHATAIAKGNGQNNALRMACVAYKLAMPKMDSLPAIRAYIACVAQGIQLEVFDGRDGSQLLYAAQVAISVTKPKGQKA